MKIVICKGNALVWNADDVRTLRQQYRIVGSLIGSHPRAPYQNLQLSLPLKLMPEEVTLLKDLGLANLVDGTFNDETPTSEMLNEYTAYKTRQYTEQNEIFMQEQRENYQKFQEKIDQGSEKRKERAKAKAQACSSASAFEAETASVSGELVLKSMAEEFTMVQLFHEEPWFSHDKLAEWTYPQSDQERLRYAVFKDLWRKGYFLTSGNKFGGDFLVYPGDPLMYHSFHIAICLTRHQNVSGEDLVSMGRLGANVRKTVVLCSFSSSKYTCTEPFEKANPCSTKDIVEPHCDIDYITLEWTGIA